MLQNLFKMFQWMKVDLLLKIPQLRTLLLIAKNIFMIFPLVEKQVRIRLVVMIVIMYIMNHGLIILVFMNIPVPRMISPPQAPPLRRVFTNGLSLKQDHISLKRLDLREGPFMGDHMNVLSLLVVPKMV